MKFSQGIFNAVDPGLNILKRDAKVQQAVANLIADHARWINATSVEECGFPEEFLRCLDPRKLGQNDTIFKGVESLETWIKLADLLKDTGILTRPDSQSPDWKYIKYIFCHNFAPFDRHNNERSYRLGNDGNFAQFSINSIFTVMKCLMIEAGFHPLVAHVILMNSILWVDTVVSQGPASWSTEFNEEYKAMAEYQRDAVRDLIMEVAGKCEELVGFLVFGGNAKASILEWARETFGKRGIYVQSSDILLTHGQNIGLRRAHPKNAMNMIQTFREFWYGWCCCSRFRCRATIFNNPHAYYAGRDKSYEDQARY
jgi:hypothetical protein